MCQSTLKERRVFLSLFVIFLYFLLMLQNISFIGQLQKMAKTIQHLRKVNIVKAFPTEIIVRTLFRISLCIIFSITFCGVLLCQEYRYSHMCHALFLINETFFACQLLSVIIIRSRKFFPNIIHTKSNICPANHMRIAKIIR